MRELEVPQIVARAIVIAADEHPPREVSIFREEDVNKAEVMAEVINDSLDLAHADMGLLGYFSSDPDPTKCVLQFSGGKDSLACLYLLRPYWDRLTVMWTNTGAAFPETLELMSRIRAMVPHFVEVKGDQPGHVALMGLPVDVVPVRNTAVGQMIQPNHDVLLQSYLECCAASFWLPMQNAVMGLGATLIIRGQRAAEARRAPIQSGHIDNGIMIRFPIENWSERQVYDFLRRKGVDVPAHYEYTKTSLDCWSCTAYLDENQGRMQYMREKHPVLWKQYEPRLREVRAAVLAELAHVDAALAVAEENRDDTHQAESIKPQNSGGLAAQNRMDEAR